MPCLPGLMLDHPCSLLQPVCNSPLHLLQCTWCLQCCLFAWKYLKEQPLYCSPCLPATNLLPAWHTGWARVGSPSQRAPHQQLLVHSLFVHA